MNDPEEYTSHNFDAVNNQIQEIADREKSRSLAYRLQSYKWLGLYGFGIALVVILFFYFSSLIYRNLNAPYPLQEIKVVKPEILEKEVIKVVKVPVNNNSSMPVETDTSYDGPKGIENNPDEENYISDPRRNVVKQYTIFKTVKLNATEFTSNGFNEVVTGWNYKDSETEYPEVQFCYIQVYSGSSLTSTRIELAQLRNSIEKNLVNNELAKEVGIFQSTLNKARKACQWASY